MTNKNYERVVANKDYLVDFSEEEFTAISQEAEKSGKTVEEFVKEATVECALNLKCFINTAMKWVKK